ncbi:MAG: oligosaccharide flippase family protein [Actinomycetia bacterium]|nr:oligosaccharide flippase family protein [Actinomycetes bacterium]
MSARPERAERSFAANAFANVGGWFVSALAGFICVPIVVRGLGADAYGLLALISAFTGYLGLMEMGLGSAIIRFIAYYRELDYGATIVAMTRVVFAWFAAAGVIGAVLMLVLAPWLAHDVLNVPTGLEHTAVVVIRLSGISFFLGMLMSMLSAIPQGFQRFDLTGLFTGIWGTAYSVGNAVVVGLGNGLVALTVFSIILNAVAVIAYLALIIRLYRKLNPNEGPSWRAVRRQVLSFAGIVALTQVHTTIAEQTNRFVVGIAAGVASAGYYQVPTIVSTNVSAALHRIAMVLFPAGSRLFARDDHEAVRALYYRTSRLFFLANGATAMGIGVFASPLLRYWVSPEFAEKGAPALAILTAALMLNAVSMSASILNQAAGRPKVNLAFSLLNSVVNLALVYPLTTYFGISGAATAGLLGAANVPFFLVYTHRRVLEVSSLSVLRRCYLPTAVGSGLCGALAFWGLVPLARGLLSTLGLLAVTVVAAMLVSGLMGAVSREDLASGRRIASSVLGRVRR